MLHAHLGVQACRALRLHFDRAVLGRSWHLSGLEPSDEGLPQRPSDASPFPKGMFVVLALDTQPASNNNIRVCCIVGTVRVPQQDTVQPVMCRPSAASG